MRRLRDLKDQNIIKVITGVRRCGKSTLLQMFADELRQQGVQQEQIQFYNFEDLDFIVTDHDGYVSYYQVALTTIHDETLERELASLNAIKDSNPKYLLTMDIDFNSVYNGVRKLNVADWMLSKL